MDGTDDWRRLCHEGVVRHAEAADREALAAARIAELEAELVWERATVAAILANCAWRLTAPLRRMRQHSVTPDEPEAPGENLFETRMRAAYEARAGFWRRAEPRIFIKKVWQRRLTDRRDVLRTYCDKQATRKSVAARLPGEVLVPRLAAVEHPADLLNLDLPDQYVVKARHGSGGSAVVWDGLGWGYLGVPRQLLVGHPGARPRRRAAFGPALLHLHGRVEVLEIASDRQREDTRYASWHDRDGTCCRSSPASPTARTTLRRAWPR